MNYKNFILGLLILLSANQVLISQPRENFRFNISHPIKFGSENIYSPHNIKIFPDTFRIVAILVQFQEDSDPLSTGNGRFDLSNKYYNPATQRDTAIDSPPYDSAYFADHLEFLKNYYLKCSNGKVIVSYEIYGQTITLPKQMKDYSPQKNDFSKLGGLFVDSWARADSIINFSNIDTNNTAFVLFHSGTGRDVDLTSLFGYDPTPYDIPTVYLGLKNLKDILGQNYNGYQTSEGISIKNTLIIPSTELRELDLFSGKYLLELGVNGILVASFGSYLGLPDLFNTQTGKTAIGRFGLMDGQSIFSYNGIFPPEPSVWEKMYLGWVSPTIISSGDSYYKIKTSSSRNNYDSTFFKVLINSTEYFLIENRNRDPEFTGQKVYTRNRNFRDSVTYTKDISGFVSYDISKIDGNLTDVKYFDWSLPGLIDDTSNYRGGILIWHIDENVISANFVSNSINNNINHKGVDVEEAKGSQDIGVTINTPFGEQTGDGTFVDYWYNGFHYVPDNIYKNEFSPTSFPNTLSYSLANNKIYITEFDTISYSMKFRVKIGDNVKPLTGFPKYIGAYPTFTTNMMQPVSFDLNGDGKDEFFINNGKDLYGFKTDGTPISGNQNGLLLYNFGNTQTGMAYSANYPGKKLVVSSNANNGGKIGLFGFDNNFNKTDSTIDEFQSLPNFFMSAPPLIFDSSRVLWGSNYGFIYEKKLDGQISGFLDTNIYPRVPVYMFSKFNSSSFLVSRNPNKLIVCGNLLNNQSKDSLLVEIPNRFYINGNQLNINYTSGNINYNPILADINKDGKQEIIFISDNKLYAVNSSGIMLDNFPVPVNREIYSEICVADVNNDGIFDIIYTSAEGDLYAYGINGKMADGFPIKTGKNSFTPSLANLNDTLGIIVFGGDGYLYAYRTNTIYDETKILWKNHFNDFYLSNNNYKSIYSPAIYSEKLPSDRCYNWPNPVYEDKTFIRYYINGNAGPVNIKILDLSGELLTKLQGTANSNADNETVWNVSNVQSGIYYGVIEAEVDGNKETKIIKIAIVK